MQASVISEAFFVTVFENILHEKIVQDCNKVLFCNASILKKSMQVLFELLTCLFCVCIVHPATENALQYRTKELIKK